jgi:hypothetical protein
MRNDECSFLRGRSACLILAVSPCCCCCCCLLLVILSQQGQRVACWSCPAALYILCCPEARLAALFLWRSPARMKGLDSFFPHGSRYAELWAASEPPVHRDSRLASALQLLADQDILGYACEVPLPVLVGELVILAAFGAY